MQRFRIFYRKTEISRFTGMLDVQKIWERWLRRAKLDLAYSQGYHPQPRLQQAAPLPLGFISDAEILDIWLETDCSLDGILFSLNQNRHPGFEITQIESIDLTSPAIQTLIDSIEYLVCPLKTSDFEKIEEIIHQMMILNTIERERRGKKYDLRPLIKSLDIISDGESKKIKMHLAAREGATGRPDEVVAAMGFDPNQFLYKRVKLFFKEIKEILAHES